MHTTTHRTWHKSLRWPSQPILICHLPYSYIMTAGVDECQHYGHTMMHTCTVLLWQMAILELFANFKMQKYEFGRRFSSIY